MLEDERIVQSREEAGSEIFVPASLFKVRDPGGTCQQWGIPLHASLRRSDPAPSAFVAPGATLGASPSQPRLTSSRSRLGAIKERKRQGGAPSS